MTFRNNRTKMISDRRRRHNTRQATKILFILLPLILYVTILVWGIWESIQQVNNVRASLSSLSARIDELYVELDELQVEIDSMQLDIGNILIRLEELDTESEITEPETTMATSDTLIEVCAIETLDTDIVHSSGAMDLAKKYEYVMFDWQGQSDVTIDLVTYGYDLMISKNMNPDVLFGIIEVESQGHANTVNMSSGASGLGQFMEGTGRYIYEDVLKLGIYNHSTTPLDPKVNIQMMVAYLEILHNQKNGNVKEMLRSYSGAGSNDEALNRYYQKLVDVLGYAP